MSPYKRLQQQLADANATIRELKSAPPSADVFQLRAEIAELHALVERSAVDHASLRRENAVLKDALVAALKVAGHYLASGKELFPLPVPETRVPRYVGRR